MLSKRPSISELLDWNETTSGTDLRGVADTLWYLTEERSDELLSHLETTDRICSIKIMRPTTFPVFKKVKNFYQKYHQVILQGCVQ